MPFDRYKADVLLICSLLYVLFVVQKKKGGGGAACQLIAGLPDWPSLPHPNVQHRNPNLSSCMILMYRIHMNKRK